MTAFQKTIKYFALALAIFLSISIISGIASVVIALFSFFEEDDTQNETKTYSISQNISAIDIKIGSANFKIRESTEISVESNLNDLTVTEEDGTLIVKEKKTSLKFNENKELIIYIPQNIVFKEIKISVGACRIDADFLCAEKLSIELGAGDTLIKRVNISKSATIKGGAGKITISDGTINNLDLKMGTGKLSLKSEILGESELDLGVGETNLELIGAESDYSVNIEKGLGKVEVDGTEVNQYETNAGKREIDIEGGVGKITLSYHAKASD